MFSKREGLLAQIEAGVLDDTVPLASLLQKCIALGGHAGSEKMRDWARAVRQLLDELAWRVAPYVGREPALVRSGP